MNQGTDLTNHFLIAMPNLQDTNFFHTVTYICEHNEQGAMGIVINRPIGFELADILMQLDIGEEIKPEIAAQTVFQGGPVQTERGFVLHPSSDQWESTLQVTDDISVTTSKDVLAALAIGKGPATTFVALGYAGWGSGQLEDELGANSWLSGPADSDIIFNVPVDKRWHAAANLLGVDLNLLSTDAGHA